MTVLGLLHPLKQPARLQLSGVEQGLVCKRVRLRDAHGRVGDAKLFVQCLLQLLREGDTVGQQHEHLLGVPALRRSSCAMRRTTSATISSVNL